MSRIVSVEQHETYGEETQENILRPKKLEHFVGQATIKKNLSILLSAAKQRNEPIEHVLFYGPPGLGKTTLAHIISHEMGTNIRVTGGPSIEKGGDLAAILTNLQEGDILFIDEIHRLNTALEEILYPAMEDFKIDLIVGQGPSAKTIQIDVPRFTLIGATTKFSKLSSPFRDRFGAVYHLNFYDDKELEKIIHRTSRILEVEAEEKAISEIAKRSRKTPRIANRLLKRARDYAQIKGAGLVTHDLCMQALKMLGVDHYGLDQMDRKILEIIIHKFGGGPVGLSTIAAATAEDIGTIEDIYEPFLMQLGFLERTPRGRLATSAAHKHFGVSVQQKTLL